MLRNAQMVGGLRMFFFQYFVQSGVFFVVPLFLSVSLGLSAIDTGVRLLPLSITLLIAAAGIPRFRPDANPRRVVRLALLAMFAGHRRAARRASTRTPRPRSSTCRCCCSAWGSAPWPPSSAA